MSDAVHQTDALRPRPEVELLLCAARTRAGLETQARIQSLAQASLDWDYLVRLAERHKVAPLLFRQLQAVCPEAVPAPTLARLQNHFYLNALRNHQLTIELCRILQLFAAHSIPAIPYKGPALAQSVYGDIALRQFDDLDLMIHPRDVAAASELLDSCGYRRQHQLTPAQAAAFLRIECEHLFSRAPDQCYLDLHWDFVPKYFSLNLNAESFWPRLEEATLEDMKIPAFKPEDLLLILSVHAAKEFWERLVWLCDLAELINQHPSLDWQQLIEQATATGARRMLLTSLTLVHDLLETPLPSSILQAARADQTAKALAAQIRQQLFQETTRPNGFARFLLPGRLLERLRDRCKFKLRLALTPSPEDWASVRLPDRLFFAYFFIRPLRLTRKYLLSR